MAYKYYVNYENDSYPTIERISARDPNAKYAVTFTEAKKELHQHAQEKATHWQYVADRAKKLKAGEEMYG